MRKALILILLTVAAQAQQIDFQRQIKNFPTTTKGDLFVFDGTAVKRLPAGTDSFCLVADSTQILGLKYVTCSSGSGTVTNFSAGALSPLFTTSVATATTTPALTFTLSNAAANTVFGNSTSGSAAPSFVSITAAMLPATPAVIPLGFTDTAIQNAINSAPAGGAVSLLPGTYNMCSALPIVINKSLSFIGAWWGVKLNVCATASATTDAIIVQPTGNAAISVDLENFNITPASGTPGRYGIHFDGTNGEIVNSTVRNVNIGVLGSNGIRGDGSGLAQGTPVLTVFSNDVVHGGYSFTNAGDTVQIKDGQITGTGAAIDASFQPGASSFIVEHNNITSDGGIHLGTAVIGAQIIGNEIETFGSFTGSNSSLIDVDATVGSPAADVQIRNNSLQVVNGITANGVRVNYAARTLIDGNRFGRGATTSKDVLITANATDSKVTASNLFTSGLPFASMVSDSSTSTVFNTMFQNSLVLAGTNKSISAVDSTGTQRPVLQQNSDDTVNVFGYHGNPIFYGVNGATYLYDGVGNANPNIALNANAGNVSLYGNRPLAAEYPPCTSTTAGLLVKLGNNAGVSCVQTLATTDTTGIVGVVVLLLDANGDSQIAVIGKATCVADNAVTDGDFLVAGTTTAGRCKSAGAIAPTTGQIVGQALATAAAGANVVYSAYPYSLAVSSTTGTGFWHNSAGVLDAASRAVDVSSADITGILKAASFPALTGDLTTSAGALATTLATVATAGTQTKITFNAKGLVTSGAQAQFSDIGGTATKAQLPATTAYTDAVETFSAAQTFTPQIVATGGLIVPNNVPLQGHLFAGTVVNFFNYDAGNSLHIGANSEITTNGSVSIAPPSGGSISITGGSADGASAVGTAFDTLNAFVTAGSLIASFKNHAVQKASIGFDGTINTVAGYQVSGAALAFSNLAGSVAASQMPALTGDVTSSAGTVATTMKNTGTAGTYTKTTFDAQGRETSGTSAAVADLSDGATVATKSGVQNQAYSYLADSGAADAYVITLAPAVAAYAAGQRFSFKVANSNLTTTPTLNVNALGTKTITKLGTGAVAAGDLAAGCIVDVTYNGTQMQLTSPPCQTAGGAGTVTHTAGALTSGQLVIGNGAADITIGNLSGAVTTAGATLTSAGKADLIDASKFCAAAGANSTTYSCNLTPAISAYVTGTHYRFKADVANTAASTINFNALGAITIKKAAGGITTDIAANDLRAGQWADLVYDGTNMQMQSTLGNAATGGASFNPLDAATLWLREDFAGFGINGNSPFGNLGWTINGVASGGTGFSDVNVGAYPHLGLYRLQSDGTAAHGVALSLAEGSAGFRQPLGDMATNTNWDSYWIFQLSQTTNEKVYIGFVNDWSADPPNGMYLRYSTAAGDTSFTFVTQSGGTATASVVNSIAANTTYNCVRIRSTVAGTVKFSIGATCASLGVETAISTNVPTAVMNPAWILTQTTTAAAPQMFADFMAVQFTGLAR